MWLRRRNDGPKTEKKSPLINGDKSQETAQTLPPISTPHNNFSETIDQWEKLEREAMEGLDLLVEKKSLLVEKVKKEIFLLLQKNKTVSREINEKKSKISSQQNLLLTIQEKIKNEHTRSKDQAQTIEELNKKKNKLEDEKGIAFYSLEEKKKEFIQNQGFLKDLQHKVLTLKEDLKQLETQKEIEENELKKLEEKIETVEHENKKVYENIQLKESLIKNKKNDLKLTITKHENNQQEKSKREETLAALSHTLAGLEQELVEKNDQKEQSDLKLYNLNKKVLEYEKSIQGLKQGLETKAQENSTVTKTIREIELQVPKKEDDLRSIEQKLKETELDLEEKSSTLNKLNINLACLKQSSRDISDKITVASEQVQRKNHEVATIEAEVEMVEGEIKSLRLNLEEITKQSKVISLAKDNLGTEKSQLEEVQQDLKQDITVQDNKLKEVKDSLLLAQEEFNRKKEEENNERIELKKKKTEEEQRLIEIKEIKAETEHLKNSKIELKKEIKALKEENTKTDLALSKQQADFEKISEKEKSLTFKSDILKKTICDKKESWIVANTQLKVIQESIISKEKIFQEMSKEIVTLESEIEETTRLLNQNRDLKEEKNKSFDLQNQRHQNLTTKLEEIKNDLNFFGASFNTKNQRFEELELEILTAQAEIKETKEENKRIKRKTIDMDQKIIESEELLSEYNKEIIETGQVSENLKKGLAAKSIELSRVEKDLFNKEIKIESLRNDSKSQIQKINEHDQKLEEISQQMKKKELEYISQKSKKNQNIKELRVKEIQKKALLDKENLKDFSIRLHNKLRTNYGRQIGLIDLDLNQISFYPDNAKSKLLDLYPLLIELLDDSGPGDFNFTLLGKEKDGKWEGIIQAESVGEISPELIKNKLYKTTQKFLKDHAGQDLNIFLQYPKNKPDFKKFRLCFDFQIVELSEVKVNSSTN